MNITIEQSEHKEVKYIKNVLYLDDNEYKENDIIIGFIKGDYVEGRLIKGDEYFYFAQNLKNGSKPDDGCTFNFKYSWSFRVEKNTFNSGVRLFNYKKEDNFDIKELELKYPIPTFKLDKYHIFRNISSNKELFKTSPIPECCGATLFSSFKRNSSNEEYKYSEIEIDEINQFLKYNITSNKIAYLLKESESQAINFLINKLNFKIVDEFKNSNTSNIIQLLSRNDT